MGLREVYDRPMVLIYFLYVVLLWAKLPMNIEFYTRLNTFIRQKIALFDGSRNIYKWDANLLKRLSKRYNLDLKLSVEDLLNQNRGYERYYQGNNITETNYLRLMRIWMIGLQFNISRSASSASK